MEPNDNQNEQDINTGFMNQSDSDDPERPQTSKYVGPDISNQTSAVPNLEETRIDRTKRIDPPVTEGTGGYDTRSNKEEK